MSLPLSSFLASSPSRSSSYSMKAKELYLASKGVEERSGGEVKEIEEGEAPRHIRRRAIIFVERQRTLRS